MNKHSNGSWDLELGGICYRELSVLAEYLTELAKTGEIDGVEFDLETLGACFDARVGDVIVYDGYGNKTCDEDDEE